jgi:hypothetical protein
MSASDQSGSHVEEGALLGKPYVQAAKPSAIHPFSPVSSHIQGNLCRMLTYQDPLAALLYDRKRIHSFICSSFRSRETPTPSRVGGLSCIVWLESANQMRCGSSIEGLPAFYCFRFVNSFRFGAGWVLLGTAEEVSFLAGARRLVNSI